MSIQKRRRIITIAAVCAGIVLGVAVLLFVLRTGPSTPTTYGGMESASLPSLTCKYNERLINRLHGYTEEMDQHYMRDTLFILQDRYDMEINFTDLDMSEVSSIEYKITDLPANSLIQSSDATDTAEDLGSYVKATLNIDQLIDEGREYSLEISINKKLGDAIHFYTRIIKQSAPDLEKHFDLVEEVYKSLYDHEKAEEVLSPFKTDSDYLNDSSESFGNVSLYATIPHISWSDMKIEETIAPVINIIDFDGELAFFKVDYQVGRDLDQPVPELYNVSEYYRIRIAETGTYLLDYERSVDQLFLPEGEKVLADHVNLGIQSDHSVESMCSPDGNHTAFVTGGSLWMLSANTKELTSVFDFISDTSDVREIYDQHDIDVVNVTDAGDVRFLVYGYMNCGLHEGESGVGLYTFSRESLEVTEDAFIPADVPYQILKNSIGNLCYLNSNDDLFIMINKNIYSVDGSTNTATLLVSGLSEEAYKVSKNNSLLAWHEGGNINDATTIKTLNMETLNTYEISTTEGQSIKALGYLNNDLIYGQGKSGDIYKDANDNEYLLMSTIYALDGEGYVKNESSEDGYYFISADQEYNRIIANRVAKRDGEFAPAEAFTMFSTELDDYPEATTYTALEEIRKQVLMLSVPEANTASAPLNILVSTSVTFSSDEVKDVAKMVDDDWQYFVYAKGFLIAPEKNAAAAVIEAYDNTGCVVNPDSSYFYRRGMRASYAEISEEDIKDAIEAYKNEEALNVTGIELAQAMTFTSRRIPLIWERDGNAYVISGYTTADSLILYDIETGETSYVSANEAERIFTDSGRCFVYEK